MTCQPTTYNTRAQAQSTLEVNIAVIEEDNAHISAVVLVYHASPRVDEVLHSQSRAWSNAGICPTGSSDREVRLYNALAAGWDDSVLRTANQGDETGFEYFQTRPWQYNHQNLLLYLARSYPAAPADPRLGRTACSERRLTKRAGPCVVLRTFEGGRPSAEEMEAATVIVLAMRGRNRPIK